MHQTPFELEQRFSGIPVSLVLFDGVFHELTGQRVLQFCGDDGKPVQEKGHVQSAFALFAVSELSDYRKTILCIQFPMLRVHPTGGLVIGETERCPSVLDAFPQDMQDSLAADFPCETVTEFVRGVCAVLALEFFVFFGLSGLDEVDDLRGEEA